MKTENFRIVKLADIPYGNEFPKADKDAVYCEIQYKRDRSSFAGMAFRLIDEKNVILAGDMEERVVQKVSQYETIYVGCEGNYVKCMEEKFSSKERNYGLEIMFLVYSDVRSSQIIFEELIDCVDQRIAQIQRGELIQILKELVETIIEMRKEENDYVLFQNEREAREWLAFLEEHEDKEALKSLENEISDRLFFKFDVQIGNFRLDNRRVELMKTYIEKSNKFLQNGEVQRGV